MKAIAALLMALFSLACAGEDTIRRGTMSTSSGGSAGAPADPDAAADAGVIDYDEFCYPYTAGKPPVLAYPTDCSDIRAALDATGWTAEGISPWCSYNACTFACGVEGHPLSNLCVWLGGKCVEQPDLTVVCRWVDCDARITPEIPPGCPPE